MREEHIVLSEEERKRLEKARKEIFGTDSVPLGEVVDTVLDEADRA